MLSNKQVGNAWSVLKLVEQLLVGWELILASFSWIGYEGTKRLPSSEPTTLEFTSLVISLKPLGKVHAFFSFLHWK